MTSTSRTAHGEIGANPWQGWGALRLFGRPSTRHDRDMGNLDDDSGRGPGRPGAIRRLAVVAKYVADTGACSRPHEPRRAGQSIPRRAAGSGISLACGESRAVASEQRGSHTTADGGLPRPRSPPRRVGIPFARRQSGTRPARACSQGTRSVRAALHLWRPGPTQEWRRNDEKAFSI